MRRREFITLLGGSAIAWPLAARAQQSGKVRTIGFLGTATASAWAPWTAAFVQRLHELGWMGLLPSRYNIAGREGRTERFAEIAAEFVRLKVDVIVMGGNAAVAAKQASSAIPIVFALASDPVGDGLVASLARPGGNITGLSNQQTDLAGKRLALLREVVPGLRRLAIMVNVDLPAAALEMARAQQGAMPVVGLPSSDAPDLLRAFRQGLKDTGYAERENMAIEYRPAQIPQPEFAVDLVRRKVNVIVAANTSAAFAARLRPQQSRSFSAHRKTRSRLV
jgi:putative ABC transport system substrate-binding protein